MPINDNARYPRFLTVRIPGTFAHSGVEPNFILITLQIKILNIHSTFIDIFPCQFKHENLNKNREPVQTTDSLSSLSYHFSPSPPVNASKLSIMASLEISHSRYHTGIWVRSLSRRSKVWAAFSAVVVK